ncbi:unnamed protein product [Oppiella nova]|uniref:C2H2-type domain-containing protein n=1 Tax=Oppiella nova TaxID=334625 RepID=A0A7R9M8M9_9ACAR|nr:unnamed protein product [Oppiella nova]CAG2172830.1 unnamed protein product [Oppiella nova]
MLFVLKPIDTTIDDERYTRDINQHTYIARIGQILRRKLSAKNSECDKLKQQIKDIKLECDRYKQVMIQLNDTIVTGNGHGTGGKSRKNQSHGCHSCCHADKPYICEWDNCGKRFRSRPHLDAHKNIHTGRRFPCDWPNCGKSFMRKYNLVEHTKLHSSVNPNVCDFHNCGKFFSSKYSLMRHQSAQHDPNRKEGHLTSAQMAELFKTTE